MENHKQSHAFMGVETGRVNGDQAGEADENQIIRGLLIPFPHVIQYLPYCGWENSEGERGSLRHSIVLVPFPLGHLNPPLEIPFFFIKDFPVLLSFLL